eukprot:4278655-Pyramimonas_sp.AAC.1
MLFDCIGSLLPLLENANPGAPPFRGMRSGSVATICLVDWPGWTCAAVTSPTTCCWVISGIAA